MGAAVSDSAAGAPSVVLGSDVVEGAAGVVVAEVEGAGAASVATAGTALPIRPMDSIAAHRSRAGEGKVTGFSSGIRASARRVNPEKTTYLLLL